MLSLLYSGRTSIKKLNNSFEDDFELSKTGLLFSFSFIFLNTSLRGISPSFVYIETSLNATIFSCIYTGILLPSIKDSTIFMFWFVEINLYNPGRPVIDNILVSIILFVI